MSQIDGWKNYFHDLAIPHNKTDFDDCHQDSVAMQVLLVEDLNKTCPPAKPVGEKEVTKHVSALQNGKAPDSFGITAEHLQFSSSVIIQALTQATNNTLISGKLVPQSKLGALTLIPKPRKQPTSPDHH